MASFLWLAVLAAVLTGVRCGVTYHGLFNMAGIRGNITFYQENPDSPVNIAIHLTTHPQTPEPKTFQWGIYTYPVLFDSKNPCSSSDLGLVVSDLSRKHSPISIPPVNNTVQEFVDHNLNLYGPKTIWGRSLLLRSTAHNDKARSCTNIYDGGEVKTVEAVFRKPVAGAVVFRQNEQGETTIFMNIFHTGEEYTPATKHEWKILVTDIVDDPSGRRANRRCEYLQLLYDPDYRDDTNCSKSSHVNCKIGDLGKKHGDVVVGSNSRSSKKFRIDTNLPLNAVEGIRTLYLVLYEKDNPLRIWTCAEMVPVKPKAVKAIFNTDGVKGYIGFSQRYRMDPTVVNLNLKNVWERGCPYHVHLFPVPPQIYPDDSRCSDFSVGGHFNPFEVDSSESPPPGAGTSDQYEVGDLSGKYGLLPFGPFVVNFYVDFNLPLFGTNSIVGRSVVIHHNNGSRWICASIGYPGPTRTAVATFVYPVIGEVILRQDEKNPWGETTVFVDLSYTDGSTNNTEHHRWDIHEREPGRDFYNWTKRCESVGKDYNPFEVGVDKSGRHCNPGNPLRCEVGDLTSKSGRINIAGRRGMFNSKTFYTDVQLPLSGPFKVLGKGLVIHDDQAPPHRGDRLACTGIRIRHPVRVSVHTWAVGTGIDANVTGNIHLTQDTVYDPTEGKVEFAGLSQLASGYHVHEVSVPQGREFPCTVDSVYDHFNPFAVNVSLGPAPGVGSSDQYEAGDLSGKLGLLDGKTNERKEFRDTNLPLQGPHSIVGRSVVVHKKERNFRWVCGTIRQEYRRNVSREVIGIASFHATGSFLHGYIRLRQLEYSDGGRGDTTLEMDLRYPDRQAKKTQGHNWAVFVSQVSHDAVEKVENVRCLAAGFRWNPFLVKSDDDYYKKDCNLANPYRCEMGDLSGRHGTLEVGGKRLVFTDVNLPLVGNFSVMGRSIVVFAKDGSSDKLGCANILPDIHLVSHVNVKKHPGFSSSLFMDHMRERLNTTDWLVVEDAQARKEAPDRLCVRMTVHFYGPEAHRHNIEFTNLITLGSVQRMGSRGGVQMVTTHYELCGTKDRSSDAGELRPSTLYFSLVAAISTCIYLIAKL